MNYNKKPVKEKVAKESRVGTFAVAACGDDAYSMVVDVDTVTRPRRGNGNQREILITRNENLHEFLETKHTMANRGFARQKKLGRESNNSNSYSDNIPKPVDPPGDYAENLSSASESLLANDESRSRTSRVAPPSRQVMQLKLHRKRKSENNITNAAEVRDAGTTQMPPFSQAQKSVPSQRLAQLKLDRKRNVNSSPSQAQHTSTECTLRRDPTLVSLTSNFAPSRVTRLKLDRKQNDRNNVASATSNNFTIQRNDIQLTTTATETLRHDPSASLNPSNAGPCLANEDVGDGHDFSDVSVFWLDVENQSSIASAEDENNSSSNDEDSDHPHESIEIGEASSSASSSPYPGVTNEEGLLVAEAVDEEDYEREIEQRAEEIIRRQVITLGEDMVKREDLHPHRRRSVCVCLCLLISVAIVGVSVGVSSSGSSPVSISNQCPFCYDEGIPKDLDQRTILGNSPRSCQIAFLEASNLTRYEEACTIAQAEAALFCGCFEFPPVLESESCSICPDGFSTVAECSRFNDYIQVTTGRNTSDQECQALIQEYQQKTGNVCRCLPDEAGFHCFESLIEIVVQEFTIRDTTVERTYVLCPNTEIQTGVIVENTAALDENSLVEGDVPIILRSNARIVCGDDGRRQNNCVVRDGQFGFASLAGQVYPELFYDNIVIQGVTFRNLSASYAFAAAIFCPTNITFIECTFEGNVGPHVFHYPWFFGWKGTAGIDKPNNFVSSIVFDTCIFKDGSGIEQQSAITMLPTGAWIPVLPEADVPFWYDGPNTSNPTKTSLILRNSMFYNNSYDKMIHAAGMGKLDIQSTCFLENEINKTFEVAYYVGSDYLVGNNVFVDGQSSECGLRTQAEFPDFASLSASERMKLLNSDLGRTDKIECVHHFESVFAHSNQTEACSRLLSLEN